VIDLASQRELVVRRRDLHRTELDTAAVLLTGTLFGVRPVTELDGREVRDHARAADLLYLCDDYAAVCGGVHPRAFEYRRRIDA
jgi:branched-subunit amino acid aminotransferase/4-amino-4-deoxychorismate lyase